MLDHRLSKLIKPCVDSMARTLIRYGIQANSLTWLGFALGLAASGLIALDSTLIGLPVLLLSRLCDGLDGAIARQTQTTDRGGFLDITLDFIFYASVPLAFAIQNPSANALAAAVLLFAFMGTSSSFLAYAAIMAKRQDSGLTSKPTPTKAIYYLEGVTEGFETLLCFSLMCWWPNHFALFSYGFSAMCFITTGTRIYQAYSDFSDPP